MLPAGHGVPHAGAREPLHVLHDDKGLLLQRDDGQVAVVQLGVAEGVEARPHWVFKRKAAVVQFPHLEGTTEKEVRRRRGGVLRSRAGNVQRDTLETGEKFASQRRCPTGLSLARLQVTTSSSATSTAVCKNSTKDS